MMTRSVGRATAAPRGGRTSGRTGRGGGRPRGRSCDQVNGGIDGQGWSNREAVVGMSWEDFKTLTREEYCPVNEMQKLENKLWNHAMVGAGHAAYTDRFHELSSEAMEKLVKPKLLETLPNLPLNGN
ncbi:hypothetical protein Tco_1062451 [Tanacetum coccineum]